MKLLHRLTSFAFACAIVGCAETQTDVSNESLDQPNPTTVSQSSLTEVDIVTEPTVQDDQSSNPQSESLSETQSLKPVTNSEPATADQTSDEVEHAIQEQRTVVAGVSKKQANFNKLMTAAHRAVDQKDWEEASRLLKETLQLAPTSTAAQDLMDFVGRQQELLIQQGLSERFNAAIHAERWTEASELAKNMNTQDSDVLKQIQRSETLINAEQLADRLLSNPERLSRPSTQTEVSRLQNLTDNVDLGKRVGEKLLRLNELSRRWTTSVVINLNSDGNTTVILRPGRSLGRFRTQKIQLMPGEYELIGRRDGFREVRRSLRLDPESEPKTIEIKVSERF